MCQSLEETSCSSPETLLATTMESRSETPNQEHEHRVEPKETQEQLPACTVFAWMGPGAGSGCLLCSLLPLQEDLCSRGRA